MICDSETLFLKRHFKLLYFSRVPCVFVPEYTSTGYIRDVPHRSSPFLTELMPCLTDEFGTETDKFFTGRTDCVVAAA